LIIPEKMESEQIIDMLYKFDPSNNSTVLVALMHGGILSSFEIEQDYYMQDTNKFKRHSDELIEEESPKEPKPKAKREKLEVVQSLL
jgi:hypothetical protein